MRRRKKKRRLKNEVELNLAAMLDMAFQLLAFFILTFRPSPVEGQIMLHLPPPRPATPSVDGKPLGEEESSDPLQGLATLAISVVPDAAGQIDSNSLSVGETPVPNLAVLYDRLRAILGGETTFEQVVIQAGSGLRYDALMSVVDVCTRDMGGGKRLAKLSFVELPSSAAPPEGNNN